MGPCCESHILASVTNRTFVISKGATMGTLENIVQVVATGIPSTVSGEGIYSLPNGMGGLKVKWCA